MAHGYLDHVPLASPDRMVPPKSASRCGFFYPFPRECLACVDIYSTADTPVRRNPHQQRQREQNLRWEPDPA
jgi:hypothetical protein